MTELERERKETEQPIPTFFDLLQEREEEAVTALANLFEGNEDGIAYALASLNQKHLAHWQSRVRECMDKAVSDAMNLGWRQP